ncbi:hypothetical protein niasHT_031883 [Heterodera trifolii]|uniref:UDP-glucuronosyltransferase n=1 Tax=Heterodera trifolii TaxID=157864 RepID=A0ABD2HT73_9BILA
MIQPSYAMIQSHFTFGLNLAKLLAENDGHEIHLLVPIKEENDKLPDRNDEKLLNVRYFIEKSDYNKTSTERSRKNGTPPNDLTYLAIANNSSLMDDLCAEQFDVGIAEAFMMSEYSMTIFHFLRIPVTIATSAMPISPHQFYLLGILSKMAAGNVPASSGLPMRSNNLDENKRIKQKKIVGTKIGDHREEQLQKRSAEIWTNHMEETLEKIKAHMEMDPIYQQLAEQKYAFDNFPGLDDIFRKTRFFLVNSQSEVDFDNYRSVKGMEKVKFIGGFNLIPKARELDEKISKKTDGKKGIVLVSFGTVVDTTNPAFSDVIEAVKETIKNFPEFLFVWKMSKGDKYIRNISNELSNVHSADWVDQQGILGNSKTVAFVSHCGMNSVLEGIYNGVPMICVPFFGDQFYNAESLARQQIGLVVDRQQDKGTVQQQLTVALAIALKLNESNVSEDKIQMDKLKAISVAFRQKNIPKIISDAFRVIKDEKGHK